MSKKEALKEKGKKSERTMKKKKDMGITISKAKVSRHNMENVITYCSKGNHK